MSAEKETTLEGKTDLLGSREDMDELSQSESDHETTMKPREDIAELKEEIRILKMSLETFRNNAVTSSTKTTSTAPNIPYSTKFNLPYSTNTTSMSPVYSATNHKISIPFTNFNYLSQPTAHCPPSMHYPFTPHQQPPNMPPQLSRPSTSMHTQPQSYPVNNSEAVQQAFQPFRKLYDLPEFSGQPEQWPTFEVSYRETSLCYNYTKLENLFRLQKALKGDAKKKVEAYLIHPESVEEVMRTLQFHYGRPHIMIRRQIAKVRAFPTISERKIADIVNFATMVSNLTIFLENAQATPHLNNPTLLDELVNKLPFSKREEWMKYSMNTLGQYPTVRQFSEWLHNVATYISLAAEVGYNNNDESVRSRENKYKPSFAITVDDRKKLKCVMCQSNHHLSQCTKFRESSTDLRWKIVKENRLCFSCLVGGHNSSQCKNRRHCGIENCSRNHNRLLHEIINNKRKNNQIETMNNNRIECKQKASSDAEVNKVQQNKGDSVSVTTIIRDSFSRKALFKYLPVQLKGPEGSVDVIAFIDDGSKVSLLEEDVARKIGLKGPKNNLSLGWIGGKRSNETSMKLEFEICNSNNNSSFHMRNVRTTQRLRLPAQSLQLQAFKNKFPILKDVLIDEYFQTSPCLLIGLPHVRLVRPHKVHNLDENFSIHETALGNILFGSGEDDMEANVFVIECCELYDIRQQMADYFSLESFGMKPKNPLVSDDDVRAEKILKETTVKIGQQYETGLLWKEDKNNYKETYSLAYKRLLTAESRMRKDKDLAKWYNGKVEEYIAKGYARKLSDGKVLVENDRTWYLPHFVITNVNKGNKRRLVFDAAATVNGESFNLRLMKGPAIYQPKPLLSILFRFRQRKIAVCGDIREMFHRILIQEVDQDAQRFLWRSGDSSIKPNVYVMRGMIFGSMSSPCSAQYVKNVNAQKFEQSHPRAYKAIVDCHYVDDYVDSFDTVDEAITVTKSVIRIHKGANFEIRGFVSNSVEFCRAVEGHSYIKNLEKNLSKGDSLAEKVLGLFWSPEDDSLYFNLKFARVSPAVLSGSRKPTKSEVLSLVMSIYDPFGFLANVVIKSKIILQELWISNTDWNAPIPDNIYKKWHDWCKELQNVRHIKIPRNYSINFTNPLTTIELHIFVDASEVAFSAVAYWRAKTKDDVEIIFVAGKSKCAPLKPLSIPRLELQAAVLGVRLKEAIISSHDIKPARIIFWSDSGTVIKWIQSDCRIYKQFVSHRIAEILEHSEVNQWKWVPGSQNPADDATRPQYFTGNTQASRWLNGPSFLKSDENLWPKLKESTIDKVHDLEVRSKFILFLTEVHPFIPYGEKSNYFKLVRIRCWFIRALKIFKCFGSHVRKSTLNLKPYITVQEIKEAEVYWCQVAQKEVFKNEYNLLESGNVVPKSSVIYKLNPFIGADGLIRVSGRINNATCVGQSTKEPIILPKNHVITKLIVKQYHYDFVHQNQEAICAAVRTKFWIPGLRQLVRNVKKNCQVCKNINVVPKPPLMGQLPVDRVTPFVRPFTYTGVDYLGPYTVSIGRRCEKRWVALFTCMATRAIHLELAKDLSTDAVILCIRNFINRRGVPIRMRSDRGTNFIGASKKEFVEREVKVADKCTKRGIEWVFNTPADPSAGGAWERMVRAVKSVLAFTLKEKSPQVETLNSLLIEADNLVNSRPLTHLPIDSSDDEPLTPNHFLLGCPNILQTPAVDGKVCLRKQWHILQQLKQTFWKRWVMEYLPDLTRRTKWYQQVKPLQVGSVVVICDETEERGKWKRGVIEEVFPAADGQVRSAIVRTSLGRLRRPASKLAVLDVIGESP